VLVRRLARLSVWTDKSALVQQLRRRSVNPMDLTQLKSSSARVEQASTQLGETNDCSVRALALVLDVSYETAHQALAVAGRARRDGVSLYAVEAAARSLGFQVRRRYSAARLRLETGATCRITTADPGLEPEAWAHLPDMMLSCPEHVAAFVGGRVEDWTSDRNAPILEALEFWQPTTRISLGEELPPVIYL
jgi:hypothetical protein